MTHLWSDYVFKLCRRCGFKSYHEKGASACRDCQLKSIGR